MNVRKQFENDLFANKKQVVEMANQTRFALEQSIKSLKLKNLDLAKTIIMKDREIDQQEYAINHKVILLISKQQPVAKDLRRLLTALKVSNDLERMADNAKNIAKATILLGSNHPFKIHPTIMTMKHECIQMLNLALSAFNDEKLEKLKNFNSLDDSIDNHYETLLLELMKQQPENEIEQKYYIQMILCARYLERFADHITNIAESTLFLIGGIMN